jgi:endonuclease/exonuclease/phosphatase family metal-dependent hydrolase
MRVFIALLLCLITVTSAFARELKVAVWNLSWLTDRPQAGGDLPAGVLSKQPEDIARLEAYTRSLKADVIAFAGVDGAALAARVFPPDLYRIHITSDAVLQRVGFAIANDINFVANPDLTALDIYPNARFRLRSAADITLNLPGAKLRLLAVHLKAGCVRDELENDANPACRTLTRQIPPLQAWISQRQQGGEPYVLMGDFNRWLDPKDAFNTRLQQTAPLLRADAGMSSSCWGGGGFLDHMLLGGPARAMVVADSLRELIYRETDPAMKQRLSTHCPVSIKLVVPDELPVSNRIADDRRQIQP